MKIETFKIEYTTFFTQASSVIFDDLAKYCVELDAVCFRAISKLYREYGRRPNATSALHECCSTLNHIPTDWQAGDEQWSTEAYLYRLSLVELLFADLELDFNRRWSEIAYQLKYAIPLPLDPRPSVMQLAVEEINFRFREADMGLAYHSGKIQFTDDDRTQVEIQEPFWSLVSDAKWSNVLHDMQIAIDYRDNNRDDPALYAAMALESTIKIISKEKGWTRGHENGAASFVDNLVSSKNGRFIDPWEADQLKKIFSDVRNPHGHGPGPDPQPRLTREQTAWVIDCAMAWIKSLIGRY